MLEIIKEYFVAWSPYIATAATAIAAAIKIIKSIVNNYDKIKKEVLTISKEQSEKLVVINNELVNVINENSELKQTIKSLTEQLTIQEELQSSIVKLQSQVVELSQSVKDQVNESINKGYEAIELQKKDLLAMGEYGNYEKFKDKTNY